MMHYFDGEEIHEEVPEIAERWQIVRIESLWGKVIHAIPKNKRQQLELWVTTCSNLTKNEAFQLIAELSIYDAPEPKSITEINNIIKQRIKDNEAS